MRLKSPEILMAFIKQKGFTKSRLARYANCSPAMITHLTKGDRRTCSRQLAEAIAEALDVPREALFDPGTSADRGRNSGNRQAVA